MQTDSIPPPSRTFERILVCRGGALGDFVVTLPVLAALRQRWPGARLDLLAYPRHAVLAQACGLAGDIRSLDESGLAAWFDDASEALPPEEAAYVTKHDLVISFLHDPDGRVRRKLEGTRAPRIVCHSPIVRTMHAVDHLGGALDRLGLRVAGQAPCLSLPAEVLQRGRARVRALGERVVLLHPGSGSPRKNWPLARYLELARCLSGEGALTVAFMAGEAERPMLADLERAGPVLANLPVLEAAGVLAAGAGYVGNDSGITHLAAAVGAPVVALFGPSDPALWAPRGARVSVLRAESPDPGGLASLPVAAVAQALKSFVHA